MTIIRRYIAFKDFTLNSESKKRQILIKIFAVGGNEIKTRDSNNKNVDL